MNTYFGRRRVREDTSEQNNEEGQSKGPYIIASQVRMELEKIRPDNSKMEVKMIVQRVGCLPCIWPI